MLLRTNKICTVYIRFTSNVPNVFKLFNSSGDLYYFRYLDGRTPRIKFNVIHEDQYFSDTPFEVVKITGIEIPSNLPTLPVPDRARWKGNWTMVVNENLPGNTPIVFSEENRIECPPDFFDFPQPIQRFLILHEKGHAFYSKEEDCDLFALINYLREGYNRSMAYYSLSRVLSRNPENIKRLFSIFNNIQKTQKTPL